MAILIGLWCRLILWVCLSPFLLKGVARPDHRLGSNSQYRRDLCQSLCPWTSGASLPKQPHLESGNEAHLHGKKSAGDTVSTSSTESRRKGGCGGQCTPDVSQPSTSCHPPHPLHLQHSRLVCFSNFLINGKALHPTGLCLI